jgi:predicted methyltransferase
MAKLSSLAPPAPFAASRLQRPATMAKALATTTTSKQTATVDKAVQCRQLLRFHASLVEAATHDAA